MKNKIKNILAKALRNVDCERVVLFGSRAKGAGRDNSDYDLLVILRGQVDFKQKMTLSTKIRVFLAEELIDADVLVKDASDISFYENKAGSIIRNALLEGISL